MPSFQNIFLFFFFFFSPLKKFSAVSMLWTEQERSGFDFHGQKDYKNKTPNPLPVHFSSFTGSCLHSQSFLSPLLHQEDNFTEIPYSRASKITYRGQKHHLLPFMPLTRLTPKAEEKELYLAYSTLFEIKCNQNLKLEKWCYELSFLMNSCNHT